MLLNLLELWQLGVPGWLSQLSIQLDFGSGHDLTVSEIKPYVGLWADSMEVVGIPCLPLSLSAPPPLSLSQINMKKNLFLILTAVGK